MKNTVSAPSQSGYKATVDSEQEARQLCAELLGISVDEMVTAESGDGSVTYCYRTQAECDADQDGAYAVQFGSAEFENPVSCHGCGCTMEFSDANHDNGEPWCDNCFVGEGE